MNENRKIVEAEYFHRQMQNVIAEYDAFGFNFSAFLSAARSAMQYALEEAMKKAGGQKWYDAHMSSRPILRFFKNLRDVNIHVQPLTLSKSVNVRVAATLVMTGNLVITKYDSQGNIIEHIEPAFQQQIIPPERQPPEVENRYMLKEWAGPEDVLTLTVSYLNEAKFVITEGITRGYISG